MINLVN